MKEIYPLCCFTNRYKR